MIPFEMYVIEKQCKEVYEEDCMWLQAVENRDSKICNLLVRPYMRHAENRAEMLKKQEPYRTLDQTIDFIFEGV